MNPSLAESDVRAPCSDFLEATVAGLLATRKVLCPKFFYDELGSQYFDEICTLSEYYPYRTELNLLPKVARDLATILQESVSVVEFGAGSLHKIQPLLDAVTQIKEFVPIDISDEHLQQAAQTLQVQYNDLAISPVTADFTQTIELPQSQHKRMGFFPGSTIGNFTPAEAKAFLRAARTTLGRGAKLLIGVDTKKSPAILHNAYNDRNGVTARFNLNILHRINRELGANIHVEQFEHYAYYDVTLGRVEMHLVSLVEQHFEVGGHVIELAQGESIHTESSYKYNQHDFTSLATQSGWIVEQSWLAGQGMFSMHLLHS